MRVSLGAHAVVALLMLGLIGPALAAQDTSRVASDPIAGVLDLSSAWQLAKKHAASYQAAASARRAGQTQRALGRAKMLPHISASFGRSKNIGTLEQPGRGGVVSQDLDYISRTNRVELTQTIFDWSDISSWRLGDAQADKSTAKFATRVYDIAIRLVDRYAQVLLAHQQVALARKHLDNSRQYVKIAQRRYQAGVGTITDVKEATSQRDLAHANLIQAQSKLDIARRRLQAMIGLSPDAILGLKPNFEPEPLQPDSVEQWVAMAQSHNSAIRLDKRAVRVAKRKTDKAFGGFLPSVDFVASYAHNQSESISTLNQESSMTSVGVNVSVPIFSGGSTYARYKQAGYTVNQRQRQLDATRQQVTVDVTRFYLQVNSSAERIVALETAVHSNTLALKAMREGYQHGTRSISDVLDAQNQLYEARRNLTKARFEYVKARIKLKITAGVVDIRTVMAHAGQWFGPEMVSLN